jgi:hypothetical protein
MQHISTADVEIISAYSLLLAQTLLMKIESLPTYKSSTQHISTANGEIISVHSLHLTQKSLTNIESLPT